MEHCLLAAFFVVAKGAIRLGASANDAHTSALCGLSAVPQILSLFP